MGRKTGESWWQYGASQESIASATKKQMSLQRLGEVTVSLREWDLF